MKILILIFVNLSTETKRTCTKDVDEIYKKTELKINYEPSFKILKNDSQLRCSSIFEENSISQNSEELLNFLDCMNFVEPSKEELNNCSLITLESNVIDETLKTDQVFGFKNDNSTLENSEKIDSVFKLFPEEKFINDKEGQNDEVVVNKYQNKHFIKKNKARRLKQLFIHKNDPSITSSSSDDLRLKYQKNPLLTFKHKIEKYMFENISDSYIINHVKRLNDIDKVCVIFDSNKLDCAKYFLIFNISHDTKFCDKLKQINLGFNKDLKFNLKTCDLFLVQFNTLIYSSFEANELRDKLEILPYFQKYLFFYYELMKLYKYIVEIPELLTLGGLFSERSFSNVIFLMHQINLFCEIFKNIKDHRVFILCMIYKTYSCQNGKNGFDIFLVPYYEFNCLTYSHDLYYFLWEFNSYKRREIKVRRNTTLIHTTKDHIFFRTTLLIFLYQHSIFIKYYNVSTEEIDTFQKFIDKSLASEGCVACILNEYLNIVHNYIKKVF